MYKNFRIVKIDAEYCNFLRKYDNKLLQNVKDRCCNFPLLEEKCKEYKKKN